MHRRLPLSDENDWSEATRSILGAAVPASESADGEGPPNILYLIGHHPALLGPFLQFSSALATQGVLPRRASEILALRASWNCASGFEWGHHVEYALAAGLTQIEVDRIALGPTAKEWSDADRLLLQAADELHSGKDLSQPIFEALEREWAPAAIVEIIFVVGHYTMLSMVARATGVPLEARLPGFPDSSAPGGSSAPTEREDAKT